MARSSSVSALTAALKSHRSCQRERSFSSISPLGSPAIRNTPCRVSRRRVPFLADDIMETFDDFRAEETFRLLSRMAQFGQVIYLTHHEHLCGIARKVCPEVRIHKL